MSKRAAGDAPAGSHKSFKTISEHDKSRFMKVYEQLVEEIIADERNDGQTENAMSWIKEMTDYNVPKGKLNRGLAVLDGVRAIRASEGKEASEKEEFLAMAVGWCIEWMQAYFLVADDIMDESITRRGQPCWYKVPKVGMVAVNDGILLESAIYKILKKHAAGLPCYIQLMELFHEVTYQTATGQLLDLITAPIGVARLVDLSKYTLPTYMRIVTYKTAFYTFYLPAAAALHLCGRTDEAGFKVAKDICVKLGQFFQIQDDYLDCYGDPKVIGKVGTDIEDNKCSWLIVQALEKATAEQRALIEANYGKKDHAHVEKIKQLYRDLGLEAVYQAYEEKSYGELKALIEGQTAIPEKLFSEMLAKIYKRQK